jgi:hypothetical protein
MELTLLNSKKTTLLKIGRSQTWWHMPIMPALEKQSQKLGGLIFEASLGKMLERPHLN